MATEGDDRALLCQTTVEAEPSVRPAQHKPGTVVGRYQLVELIGEGGMGVVYRARDPYLSREVAVKLISAPSTSKRASLHQARLLREAQALAKLSHPNVVAAFDVGSHGEGMFIAMELIDGMSLNRWLAASKHNVRDIVRVLVAAGRGLAAAHAAGFMHRDFKPGNVMVSSDGRVRVVDFGLARTLADATQEPTTEPDDGPSTPRLQTEPEHPLDEDLDSERSRDEYVAFLSVNLSRTGAIMGTPGYMAPEQLDHETLDARADQFAFAATAFYALTGQTPYVGKNVATYTAAVTGNQRATWPKGTPRRIRKVIERGLAVKIGERYRSVDAMVEALERTLRPPRALVYGGVAALAALAALAATLVASRASEPEMCVSDDTAFDSAWTPGQADRLRDALVATQAPGARDIAAIVVATFDETRRRWLEMRHSACVDTSVKHTQPPEVLTLRTVCLETRRANLARFVDALLHRATPELVERATSIAREAANLKLCADIALLVERERRLPEDAVHRAAVIALTDRFEGLSIGGDPRTTAAALRELAREAERVEHPITLARIQLELADALSLDDQRDEAIVVLRQALRAAGAAGSWTLRSYAATRLLHALVQSDRFVEAEQILPFVESLVEPTRSSEAGLALLLDAAAIAANRDDNQKALRILGVAQTRATALGDEVAKVRIANEMAITFDGMSDHVSAERWFREALAAAQLLYGKRSRSSLLAYGNVITALAPQRRFDEAFALLGEARALAAEFPQDRNEVINLDVIEGMIWQSQGDCARASTLYLRGAKRYTAASGPDTPQVLRARIRAGKCLLAEHRAAEAVPHFEEWLARRIAEHAADDWQGEAGFLLAQALWESGARRRAVATAQTALARYQSATGDFKEEIAELSSWLARHPP
jgi:eukaryotic-like serine/threonine-protein kinase